MIPVVRFLGERGGITLLGGFGGVSGCDEQRHHRAERHDRERVVDAALAAARGEISSSASSPGAAYPAACSTHARGRHSAEVLASTASPGVPSTSRPDSELLPGFSALGYQRRR